jgi:hypothetical protein
MEIDIDIGLCLLLAVCLEPFALVQVVVSADNVLYEGMSDHIQFGEMDEADSFRFTEKLLRLDKAGKSSPPADRFASHRR